MTNSATSADLPVSPASQVWLDVTLTAWPPLPSRSQQTSRAFLSTRRSIAWLPDPPSEPTETLVLTGSKWYIDLRVLKEGLILDWGMAGIKETVGGTEGASISLSPPSTSPLLTNMPSYYLLTPAEKPRARFTNHLDSHQPDLDPSHQDPESDLTSDEGDFETLPSGDTRETGSMLNSETGLVQPYEEIWSSVYVPPGEEVLLVAFSRAGSEKKSAYLGLIGDQALALWRNQEDLSFGAWKARREGGDWSTTWLQKTKGETVALPQGDEWEAAVAGKREGDRLAWGGQYGDWIVLERGLMGKGRLEGQS